MPIITFSTTGFIIRLQKNGAKVVLFLKKLHFFLVIYPEGTTFAPQKRKTSAFFIQNQGLGH